MNRANAFLQSFFLTFFMATLALALEYIEFGCIDLRNVWTRPTPHEPRNLIHVMNMTIIFMTIFFAPLHLFQWWKAKREESEDKESGKDKKLRDAIAQFDPATMIAEEPLVEAQPFPKRWLWIIGLYAVVIAVLFYVAPLIPNPYAHKKMLERNDDYTALIALEPNNAVWYFKRGNRHSAPVGGHNIEKAIEDYDRAIQLKPDYAEAYQQRAQAKSGRFNLSDILANSKGNRREEFEKWQQKNKEANLQALIDADEAIRLNPKEWTFYSTRASIRSNLDDFDGAERDYTQMIELKPSSLTYPIRGSFFEYQRKDLQKALADYTTAIECAEQEKIKTGLYSDYPLVILYRSRGQLYEKLGEPDKAKADFDKAK
jgi:tetratricopeptide (TPR) repeat protein